MLEQNNYEKGYFFFRWTVHRTVINRNYEKCKFCRKSVMEKKKHSLFRVVKIKRAIYEKVQFLRQQHSKKCCFTTYCLRLFHQSFVQAMAPDWGSTDPYSIPHCLRLFHQSFVQALAPDWGSTDPYPIPHCLRLFHQSFVQALAPDWGSTDPYPIPHCLRLFQSFVQALAPDWGSTDPHPIPHCLTLVLLNKLRCLAHF